MCTSLTNCLSCYDSENRNSNPDCTCKEGFNENENN